MGLGAGLDVLVRRNRFPALLSLGIQYHENGSVRHLPVGGVVDNGDGTLSLFPIASGTNLITYRIGVSVLFPR